MAVLNDITTAIVNQLQQAQWAGAALANNAAAVVLREDAHDLQTEINRAIGQIGMLILVGMPHFVNKATQQNPNLESVINCAVAVGEHPILWRKDQRDPASTVAHIVAQLLHNLKVPGFNWLRVTRGDYVPDKKRQLYEVAIETLLIAPTAPSTPPLPVFIEDSVLVPALNAQGNIVTYPFADQATDGPNVGKVWKISFVDGIMKQTPA
jgi:hypothetical protein